MNRPTALREIRATNGIWEHNAGFLCQISPIFTSSVGLGLRKPTTQNQKIKNLSLSKGTLAVLGTIEDEPAKNKKKDNLNHRWLLRLGERLPDKGRLAPPTRKIN